MRVRGPAFGASTGQSLVETVATAPIVLLCGLIALQALAAGSTYVYADNAAHAGALARQLGEDPAGAARRAVPGWSRGAVRVSVREGSVRVRLQPRAIVPQLSGLLAVDTSAAFAVSGGG